MKTQTMNVKIGGVLKNWTSALTLVTFLFVQNLPFTFAQEVTLAPQTLAPEKSVSSTPPLVEKPVLTQSSTEALKNAGQPLSVPAKEKKEQIQNEIRGQEEYSFDEAIDQLQAGIASAVIVKKISSWSLRKLLELNIEVGIAVIHGKIVLFTSGEEDQIRMLPAAKELLKDASVIAHTHPGGAIPSAEDFLQAGLQTEYVISNKGIYAYNHNGLIYSKPLSFGYLVGKLNAARKPKASTKDTRDALNEFIADMDEYDEQPETAVLFRSAITETNAPSNANFSFVRNAANFYLKNKITGELMFIATIGATESVPSFDVDPTGKLAVVNITGSSIPQGGKILAYDIVRKMLVTATDHLTGQLRAINGTVYDNCNCSRSTPYYFVDGLVLFNTRGLPVNGYTSTSGNFLNFTTPTFRTIQTPTFAFYGAWQDRLVLTPQKDKLIYAVGYDVIHASLMIYDLSTGVINGQAMPSSGFGGIKAVSSSGDYAIVASNLRDIYAVSLRTTQAVHYVSITQLPGGTGYKLKTARFLNSTVAEGFLDNGERILLRIDATNFDIIQPGRTIKAPSNANFSFRTVIKSTNDGFNIYLVNHLTGAVDFLASAGFKEELLYFDVDPTGKFALFNVFGSIHPKGGYVRIFNITQKLFVNPVNSATGSIITINGILNANSNLASAFKFVDQFVVFAYHTLGYSEPGGGYVLNLNKTPMWATSANVNIFELVVMIPQKDRLLFGGSSGIGIYNVATGAVNYQASGGISIRAVSPDGEFAIVASVENKIYAVSVRNLSQATRSVTMPLQCNIAEYSCWSSRTAYALKSAIFLNPTLVEGTLVNGKKIYLHIDAQRFDIVTSPSTVLTPNDIKPLPLNGVMQGSIAFPAPTFIAPIEAVSTGTLGDSRGHYFYYETRTAGWAGTGLTYDNFSTSGIETGDLSGVPQLTFGIMRGNPSLAFATKVKFEIVDNLNRKASVYLEGISDVEKVWSVPTLIFKNAGVNLTKVRLIYFIVEGQNLTGALQVNRYPTGSTGPAFNLSTANITVLPGDPQKNHVAPPGADSSGAGTPRGMFLNYTTGTPGWAGGGFSYDNFDTAAIETGDLSGMNYLTFGLKGTPPQVKFEVVDYLDRKTAIYLHGIRSDIEQVWTISTATMASYGIDLTKVKMVYFIVEGANQVGSLEINRFPIREESIAQLYRELLGREPELQELAAWNNSNLSLDQIREGIANSNEGFVVSLYRTLLDREPEPAGRDSWIRSLEEGTSREQVRQGFLHSPEFEQRAINIIIGFYQDLLHRAPDEWGLAQWVERAKSGVSQNDRIFEDIRQGFINSEEYQSRNILASTIFTTADITLLLGNPQKNHVAPPGADSSGAGTPRGMFLNYTTGTPGWAGGGFSYDNFDTAAIETSDISQYQNLRFGLKGDASQLKFEVLDAFGRKTSIYLHGIRPDVEQVWSISTQSIASYGVDLTKIRWIYFIVEGQNKTGTVEINKVPAIAPNAAAITPLPATPRVVKVAPTGATANVSTISRGARLDYSTSTAGWAGAGFSFDDPATTTVESANISTYSNLTFGLKGNPTQVKFELVDASGKKASVILTGISSTTEQRWSIPTSMFFGTGLDLTRITSIYFIVEGQNQSGSLEIYRM